MVRFQLNIHRATLDSATAGHTSQLHALQRAATTALQCHAWSHEGGTCICLAVQVETAAGVWSAVPASGGAMTAVVMVGRTLEHATGGVLKATTHRVPHAPVGRQSVAFHQRAHRAATLDTTMLWAGEASATIHVLEACTGAVT